MKSLPIIVVAIALLLVNLSLVAQVERVLPRRGSSALEGTSFVVGFMQNELLEVGADPRLQLFVSSQYDATVTIASPFTGVTTVKVPAYSVHVETVPVYHMNSASEVPLQKSIFIESDVPVVVYVLNTLTQSTDTYAAIPIRHLGTKYYSINRPSDRYRRSSNPTSTMLRSGEFMVMAVEDGTSVDISPRAATKGGIAANSSVSITLNRGDCYLVQARAQNYGQDDLTGSSIISSKPVAVISGHMRTSVPLDTASSKDHLVEQLPPTNKWGKSFASAPLALSARGDVFRIMASKPNQSVSLTTRTRTRTWILPTAGSWVDTTLSEPASWTSADPFFLAQHMSSATSSRATCDPAMVIVPPVEQYVNEALFRFPTLERVPANANQRFFYYINLLATPEALASLMIGQRRALSLAPQLNTQVIPGTNLRWAQIALQEGAYLMRCDSGSFNAVMYGTSDADSYANLVGLAFDPIRSRDSSPPVYELTQDCGKVFGRILDVSRDTARLKDVEVITARTFNYNWTISKPLDSIGTVNFDASVRDRTKDAQIVIHAYDDRGYGREWLYRFDAPDVEVVRDVILETQRGRELCTTVVIRNRDSTPVTIQGLDRQGNQRIFIARPTGSFVIRPRDSAIVTLCATQWTDTAAMAASITLRMLCGNSKTFYVKTRISVSMRGDTLDLGDVRLGDTACGRVRIINDGDRAVDVRELIATKLDSNFIVDTAQVGFPRLILGGDTLWLRVCFVARQRGRAERIDSVYSQSVDSVNLVYRARGVSPEVAPLVIDWRERRIGSVNDTSLWLVNTGDSWCILNSTNAGLPTALSIRPDGIMKGARLAAGDSVEVAVSFRPIARDTHRFVLPVSVDWRPHAPLSIELRGIGVMPDITVRDIDFDSVVIGTTRDSLADLVSTGFAGGNTDLRVFSVSILGQDSAAFTVPNTLRNLAPGVRPLASILSDVVSFMPIRLGPHECLIEVECDAAPAGNRLRSRFRLLGVGIPVPLARPTPKVSTRLRARSCSDEPINVEVFNGGTATARLDSVSLTVTHANGNRTWSELYPGPAPLRLVPGQRWTTTLNVIWDTAAQHTVILRLVDSAGVSYEDSVSVEVEPGATDISVEIPGAPTLVAGPSWITMRARLDQSQTVDVKPSLRLMIDRSRFVLDRPDSSYVTVEQNGLERVVQAEYRQQNDFIRVTLRDSLRGPWSVTSRLRGTMTWQDPDFRTCFGVMEGSQCFRQNQSIPVDYRVDPCGSRLRMVDLGGRPGIYIDPLRHPYSEVVSVRIVSSVATTAKVWAESISGQQFQLAEHLSLQKGSQHCNFSCSGLASGLYRLIVRHEYGVEVMNIIIVN